MWKRKGISWEARGRMIGSLPRSRNARRPPTSQGGGIGTGLGCQRCWDSIYELYTIGGKPFPPPQPSTRRIDPKHDKDRTIRPYIRNSSLPRLAA
ncbi:hypothetical protein BO70DRAFT_1091 [Aspergillus heteromorphus CBS 117.55]|uniref:Uncharacterized protein n=1 Tax=Aspergillus heteromorphus CBS 117.55 TaxID=1448321 RepID=A0A317X064_9EURO|nr:uncharacterized protein BO70DRAFT_1091 [Aspergillus heteromorphus CBS 117.55]PWY92036.1 hypothetical protein BO70DRAFT_1091 [Aspergillus heteromorphus CBS 117.55]